MAQPVAELAASAAEWTLALVAEPSVTGTAEEAAFADWLAGRLRQRPAFAGRPEHVWTIPVADDRLGRASVAALVRGAGNRTVVLTGHFDTVHLHDYGDLAPLARDPHRLREALLARLAPDSPIPEARARADLEGGAFLPGRGLLDMKSGLAAGLAVLEDFAAEPDRVGNLLFLAVPDEEANSAGARSAAAALPEIARRFGLSLAAAINLDALTDDGDGATGRAVALGTIGKLLPSALVIGDAVHAANALAGVNAGALAAEIVAGMEWAPTLTDRTADELAPPPALLGLKDNRTAYDVTTPDRVWAYWNVMSHRRGATEVLEAVRAICRDACAQALRRLAERAAALGETPRLPAAVPVVSFGEFRREVFARDPNAAGRFAALARDVAEQALDLPEQCRILTEHLWSASGRAGPGVVIGFASLPYLPTELNGSRGERLEQAVRDAAARIAARHATSIAIRRFFPGISDMSHFGQADGGELPLVGANTPAWGFAIRWPEGHGAAGIPVVNAGPWGRDYHTRLERLQVGYAFEVLPELVDDIVRNLLKGERPR